MSGASRAPWEDWWQGCGSESQLVQARHTAPKGEVWVLSNGGRCEYVFVFW